MVTWTSRLLPHLDCDRRNWVIIFKLQFRSILQKSRLAFDSHKMFTETRKESSSPQQQSHSHVSPEYVTSTNIAKNNRQTQTRTCIRVSCPNAQHQPITDNFKAEYWPFDRSRLTDSRSKSSGTSAWICKPSSAFTDGVRSVQRRNRGTVTINPFCAQRVPRWVSTIFLATDLVLTGCDSIPSTASRATIRWQASHRRFFRIDCIAELWSKAFLCFDREETICFEHTPQLWNLAVTLFPGGWQDRI